MIFSRGIFFVAYHFPAFSKSFKHFFPSNRRLQCLETLKSSSTSGLSAAGTLQVPNTVQFSPNSCAQCFFAPKISGLVGLSLNPLNIIEPIKL